MNLHPAHCMGEKEGEVEGTIGQQQQQQTTTTTPTTTIGQNNQRMQIN